MNIENNAMSSINFQQLAAAYGSLRNFDIIHRIGKGQFSVVYSARNRFTGQSVALKKVEISKMTDAKAIEDCKREIYLLQKLNHPNVIKYISHFVEDNDLYIVLELAGAGDMTKMIANLKKENRWLTEKSIWKFFRQICSGLEHMHSKRIMHRGKETFTYYLFKSHRISIEDIKPANIFISADGVVRLGDLGLSRYFSSNTTSVKSLVGTPYYMAPERIQETSLSYDFQSDIWSLGCILYEMAAFHSPFYEDALTLPGLRGKIEALHYKPLSSHLYSLELRTLVARCLRTNPEERPDITEVNQIAQTMYARFVQQTNQDNNATPTPMSTSHNDPSSGSVTPVNEQ